MQGLFIDNRRPKSKKEVRELIAQGEAHRISVEATSLHGYEDSGPLDLLIGKVDIGLIRPRRISFVGPDPYTSRRFYGTLTITKGKVTVK